MTLKVTEWRDSRSKTPRAADQGVIVLDQLLKFGKRLGLLKVIVTEDVRRIYKSANRSKIIWTEVDIAAYYAAADEGRGEPMKDILDLGNASGLRREDMHIVDLDHVGEHALVIVATKKSDGERRPAIVPMTPQLREVIARLRTRYRAPGVKNLLVNSKGQPWGSPGAITQAFNQTRDAANSGSGIVEKGNPAHGEPDRKKHLHDTRGTFVTHLCIAGLTNEEIARIVGWSPQNVDRVRRFYVDDTAVVVALAERIANASVKRSVKQGG